MDDLEAYRILELEPGASLEQVKRAWRDLAKVWHPDRFQGDERLEAKAENRLKAVNAAYAHLVDRFPSQSSSPISGARPQGADDPERRRSSANRPPSPQAESRTSGTAVRAVPFPLTILAAAGLVAQAVLLLALGGIVVAVRIGLLPQTGETIDRFADLQSLAFLATALAFLIWEYNASAAIGSAKPSPGFFARNHNFKPSDAIAFWFIPIYNLFRPVQVLRETWDRSVGNGNKSFRASRGNILTVWWALFLVSMCLGKLATKNQAEVGLVAIRFYAWILTSAMAASLASWIVLRIGGAQSSRPLPTDRLVDSAGTLSPVAWSLLASVGLATIAMAALGLQPSAARLDPARGASAVARAVPRKREAPLPTFRQQLGYRGLVSRVVETQEDFGFRLNENSEAFGASKTVHTVAFLPSGAPIEESRSIEMAATSMMQGFRRVERTRYSGDLGGRPATSTFDLSRIFYAKDGTPTPTNSTDSCIYEYGLQTVTVACETSRFVDTYNAEGRLVRSERDQGYGTLTTIDYEWDSNGCVTAETTTEFDTPVSPKIPAEDVQFFLKERNAPYASSPGVPKRIAFVCERQGEIRVRRERESVLAKATQCTEDVQGNHLECTETSNGKPEKATHWRIEYFDPS